MNLQKKKKCWWLVLPLLLMSIAADGQATPSATFAISHVTVIDMTGAPAKPDMTVILHGEHIAALGRSSKLHPPKYAKIVDAKGKFLIPGLWDMHTHNFFGANQSFYSLYIANGVTGVRDMGGLWQYFDAHKKALSEGQPLNGPWPAPRMVAAGVILDGKPPVHPSDVVVTAAEEARHAVDVCKRRGADVIKVYSMLNPPSYFAIAEEAKKNGLPFAGHVPLALSAAEASDAGQKSMEHSYGILLASSTEESKIREQTLQEVRQTGSDWRPLLKSEYLPVDSYDPKKAAALFARFVRNGTWVCPTLVVEKRTLLDAKNDVVTELSNRYVPRMANGFWKTAEQSMAESLSADDKIGDKNLYPKYVDLVGAMNQAGVLLLAGTDTPNPWVLPGFSLHEELGLLVKAGLTPMQALRSATVNPARFLGMEKELGTVEKGKLADLVLLDADPLANIHNTTKIEAVIVNGRYLSKSDLQQMLAEVTAAAKE